MLRVLVTALLLSILASTAWAQPEPKGEGYAQAGRPWDFGSIVLTSANTDYTVTFRDRAGAVRPACFAFRELVTWQPEGGAVTCVYAMTSSVTFANDVGTRFEGRITDTALSLTGRGAGWAMVDKEPVDAVPSFQAVYEAPGARRGICSAGRQRGPGGRAVAPACRIDGDCTDAGAGGNCDTSTAWATIRTQLATQGCAFVRCQADTAGTVLRWRVDR